MLDQLIVALEDEIASLALKVAARRPQEPIAVLVIRLVLVDLSGFLASVLEPDDDDPRTQLQLLAQNFQIVVFGVGLNLN